MAGRKLGRPSKGDRVPMHVRVPRAHREVYERAAVEAGLPLGDYVALALARAHDLEEPGYIRNLRNQAELPMGA